LGQVSTMSERISGKAEHLPQVELLPDPDRLRLLARVRLGAAVPITAREREMLEALPHRHTHRGPFEPGPLPAGCSPDCNTTR
jgi:hypothetical protein